MNTDKLSTPGEALGRGDNNSGVKKPELLLPAGSMDTLKVAFHFGADAVYLGGSRFGLRAKAGNFTPDQMKEAIEYAHGLKKKVYVTVNIYAHHGDLEGLGDYLKSLDELGPDALLISDPGVFSLAKREAPHIPIHISTQANTTNFEAARFWYEQGATRVVTARELSIEEIKKLRENIPDDMEIESFVHGSMCISYSGRCLLSSYMTGRDANRGACTHPCRWNYDLHYAVEEQGRRGQYFPVEEDDRGTYIFSSKDISMIGHIDDLIEAGVDSFKIEGRMKNALYVAVVAGAYRRAIDEYVSDPDAYRAHIPEYEAHIRATTYRPFGTGFYYGSPGAEGQIYDNGNYITGYTYLGTIADVDEHGRGFFIQKNKFSVGERIEIMGPGMRVDEVTVLAITTEDGEAVESCPHAGQRLFVTTDGTLFAGDIIARREDVKKEEDLK